MLDMDIDGADAEDRTPETLLRNLTQLHLQTMPTASAQEQASGGWRAVASCTSVLAARLLHVVQRIAPDEAARIADWYAGPFGEGPDGGKCVAWLAEHVAAPAGADIETWIDEAHTRALTAATRTDTTREN
jgi:hypothetical protein